MPGFDDLFRKAQQIAREEGISLGGDSKKREILPSAPPAKIDKEKAKRVAERVAGELGVNLEAGDSDAEPEPRNEAVEPAETKKEETQKTNTVVDSGPDPNDVVQEQLDILEAWTVENLRLAKRDAIRFWALKLPAIASSASVAAFEAFGYGQVVIILAVVAALCIAVDGLFPGGQLHNVHKRAASEARRLQQNTIIKWRQAQLDPEKPLAEAAKATLATIQKERTRIDKYVTEAESSLGNNQTSPGQ